MAERSRVLGQLRLAIVYLFIAALVLVSKPTPQVFAIGLLLAATGEAFRIWAAGHLVKSVRLITSGPYAHTQNPLYLGRLLILTGVAIAARSDQFINLVALVIGYAVFFLYYIPRKIRVEGGRLARLHGAEFEAYHKSVPMLFPSLRRYPAADRTPWSLRLMVSNQEPFVLAGLVLVFVLFGWKVAHP
jgi:protein-S-isoprenylcysteine O-methyltransferase Ste14